MLHLPVFLFTLFTKIVVKGYPNSKTEWRKRSFINAKKSPKFSYSKPPHKILHINFYTLGQILIQLKLTSMALGFIKVVKSFAQISHTAEIPFSTIIKHKIKLSVLLYVKRALFVQHHFFRKKNLVLVSVRLFYEKII